MSLRCWLATTAFLTVVAVGGMWITLQLVARSPYLGIVPLVTFAVAVSRVEAKR